MVDQIERHITQARPTSKKTADATIASLAKIGRSLRAIAYGFSAKTKIKMPGFAEIEAGFVAKDMIDRDDQLRREDPLLDRTLYYNAFQALAEAVPEKSRIGNVEDAPRIIVFIDDLDRCLPDTRTGGLELDLIAVEQAQSLAWLLHSVSNRQLVLILDAFEQQADPAREIGLLRGMLSEFRRWPPIHIVVAARQPGEDEGEDATPTRRSVTGCSTSRRSSPPTRPGTGSRRVMRP